MAETNYAVGNGRRQNKKVSISAGNSVTFHFHNSGTDTPTDKYYDLRKAAWTVDIITTAIATITHIQNKELDSPITLGIGSNSFTKGIAWGSIIVKADAATTVEILAYWGTKWKKN